MVLCMLYIPILAAVMKRRTLRDLKHGQPHLLVVPSEQVLRAALSLYMEDTNLPMPTPEEMLICNLHTTAEEVRIVLNSELMHPCVQCHIPPKGESPVAEGYL